MHLRLEALGFMVSLAPDVASARALLDDGTLDIEAIVLRPDDVDAGSAFVDRVADREPACASLVLVEPTRAVARCYRRRGAFRCVSPSASPSALVPHITAAVADARGWRGSSSEPAGDDPPRVWLDVERAAERLRYLGNLSNAEFQVVWHLLMGRRDAEIAVQIGRAERTAKRHVGSVLSKLDIKNRASLWRVLHDDAQVSPAEAAELERALAGRGVNAHRRDRGRANDHGIDRSPPQDSFLASGSHP